ncbi:nucleotide exchange factor GrpE [Butyrivibrio sp. VCD2006]|uniref:nucleotide exchange factor GrpE n=1 Tax=Butyrivibrio sp. VCD2006 TaxID=1280664 RepID=UPI00041C7F4C|nr:nucleotide exchange factor GrpE [Butyrivibrio sp. VCD2006]
MSKEVKKDSATESEKKTAKELQQEVAEKAKEVAEAANKVAEAAEEAESEAEVDAPEAEGNDSEAAAGEKKGLFGKKEKKNPFKEKFEEMQDKYLRQVAEFENFRKRTDKEKAQMFDQGASNVLEKMLPIVDNFERGLAAVPEDEKNSAFADGMNMIYKQLVKQMEDLGVTQIEAVGKEFDPNFHNAVMQVDSEEYEEGIVAQELQKGYMYRDMVLRHSMVAVAK